MIFHSTTGELILCNKEREITELIFSQRSVSSVYFANGATVDVAKIEGGPTYKDTMRKITTTFGPNGRFQTADVQTSSTGPSIYDWLPPRLRPQDATTRSLTRMLNALKVATESYLEQPVSVASLSVPLPLVPSHEHTLRAAASSLSLRTHATGARAGILAAIGRGIDRDCYGDPEQLVLAIGYGRTALTAWLMEEDCGVFEHKRELYEPTLGSDSSHKKCGSGGIDDCLEGLRTALQNFSTVLPSDSHGYSVPHKRINELVLYGEGAADRRLHEIVREVLPDQYEAYYGTDNSTRNKLFDPVFGVAHVLAKGSQTWDRDREYRGCLIPPNPDEYRRLDL